MDEKPLTPTDELVKQLTAAFRESRTGTDKQLEEVNKTLSQIVPDIRQLQRDVLLMQADMRTRYVSREEYEPRHQAVLDKMRQYDDIITASQPARDRFVRMEEASKNQDKSIEGIRGDLVDLEKRFRGLGQRAVPWISAALAAIALALTFLSHVSFR
jgi:hypothetical protein